MRSLIVIELFRRPASTKGIFFGLLFALLLTLPAQAVNRLAAADSPYLRQHADNPVDWYPWGDEAFAKARSENKPVFLSIGYSSCCYWCRVADETFYRNPAIAAQMNAGFVNIKLDREQRPDLDRIYMAATHLLGGQWRLAQQPLPDPGTRRIAAASRHPNAGLRYWPSWINRNR